MSDYETRFGAIGRLYGTAGLARIRKGHICVIGLGGVGSWAVEAFARSGIGALTLVDMDEVYQKLKNETAAAKKLRDQYS